MENKEIFESSYAPRPELIFPDYIGKCENENWLGMEPRYKHLCPHCMYLGQFENYDLYICKLTFYNALILRFDNLHEYHTSVDFKLRDTQSYLLKKAVYDIAKHRAKVLGYYVGD